MYMRTAIVLTALMLMLVLPVQAQGPQVTHGQAIHHDTSPPLRDMAIPPVSALTGESREVPIRVKPDFGRDPRNAAPDGGLQSLLEPALSFGLTPAPMLSVPGLSEQDNINTVGAAIVPPDTNGDIGLDGGGNRIYIQ